MLTRTLAAAALVALSIGTAHAGSVINGKWAPSACGNDPGNAPEISSKSPDSYNKSMKEVQAWQDSGKTFTECLVNEGKADQSAIVSTINAKISDFNTQNQNISAANTAAVEKLNGGASKKRALGAGAPHN